MFKYKGIQCPYCHKEFEPTDEILICPDCGAPYHRDCVRQSGGCVLTDLHEKGESWQPPQPASDDRSDSERIYDGMAPLRCSRCGTINPSDRLFCEVCGNPLNRQGGENDGTSNQTENSRQPFHQMAYNPYTTPFGGLSPDEEIDGVPVHDLAIYVGENTHYFLPKFKEFKTSKKIATWNWPAFFLDFYYLIYRKMWGAGIIVLILSLILSAPSTLITLESMAMMVDENASILATLNIDANKLVLLANFFSFLSLGLKLALATTVNRLYSDKVFRDVKKLRTEHGEEQDYSTRLSAKGGTGKLAVIISVAATMILSMAASALITSLLLQIGF